MAATRRTSNDKARLEREDGDIGAKLEMAAKDKKDLEETEAFLVDMRRRMARLVTCDKLLAGDLKVAIAELCIPQLNTYANEFLHILRPGMEVEIASDGANLSLSVTGGSSASYMMLSGGEQEAIRLAMDMALSTLSSSGYADLPNIIFLDEIFGSLDAKTCENVFALLEALRDRFGRIMVITHDPLVKERFRTVLRVDKTDGVSRISYEKRG